LIFLKSATDCTDEHRKSPLCHLWQEKKKTPLIERRFLLNDKWFIEGFYFPYLVYPLYKINFLI